MARYAVGLLPDRGLEESIRGIWDDLRGMGIGSNLLDDRGRPHLSLAVCRGLPGDFGERFDLFAAGMDPIGISLQAAGTFGLENGVVFLAPSVTLELTGVHQRFYDELGGVLEGCSRLYMPGLWVPHCTVAMGLAAEEVCRAIGVCAGGRLPLEGSLERAAVMEFGESGVLSVRECPDAGGRPKGPAHRPGPSA